MMGRVTRWAEAVDAPAGVGGKAEALARLFLAGFPVPPWFIVLPDAFRRSADVVDPRWAERRLGDPGFPGWVATLSLHPDVAAEIEACLRDRLPGADVAVRSSARGEDAPGHSFAGQLESYLWVPRADVPRRIALVWASAFTPRVLAYRRERGLEGAPEPPAVIVQQMVDPEAAGVAFSSDPVGGRRAVAVVSAVWGLGAGLVSGECDADTWRVDRTGEIIERHIARKAVARRRDPAAGDGTTAVAVAESARERPCLADETVQAAAALARRAAEHFGCPQDIEWAQAGGVLTLLQSRPITSLADLADPDGAWALWDNSNIAESYSGITTPLTFSFARMAYAAVYEQFCRLMAVPEERIAANRVVFRRMLGLVRGRIYYNLLSWYRVLALLPGFTINRRFMEQMMGVKAGLPPAALRELEAAPGRAERWRDGVALLGTLVGLVRNHRSLERQVAAFQNRLDRALAPPAPPLAAMRLDELAAHYHALERELLLRWDAPLVNDFFAMIFFGLLRDLSRRWIGAETLPNDLLSGEGGLVSTEPVHRIRELAARARTHAGLVDLLCQGEREAIDAVLPRCEAFAAGYREYLERFGERCLEELKLETLTLADDPLPLLRAIGQAARRGLDGQPAHEQRLRRAAEERVAGTLSRSPLRRAVFGWVLRRARLRVKTRENLRFERTRLFGRVRRLVVEMGRRLAAEGRLEDARDVFFLTLDELFGFVEGTTVATDLRAQVAVRRAEFGRWRAQPAPADRFETRGAVHLGNRFAPSSTPATAPDSASLHGLGCCPGQVRGRARVVLAPQGAEIHAGEILVAARTDPGWILLFPAAAGLLVEHGSLLSHSAIVARELGLPAIVALPGLLDWVKDGEWVEMDGATGVARKVGPGP
jgi:pyruvate,water dikinase